MPAIGTGLLKYPAASVARCIVHAVADFARTHKKTHLKNISLVIYHKDETTIKVIVRLILFLKVGGRLNF